MAACANGRFPHAALLEGPKGCGKKTFARLMAAALLCQGEEPPCGVCGPCRKIRGNIHPDVLLYGEEGGARSFHIDVIRELKLSAYVAPNESPYKVYILCDVQNMTIQAQNALLKIIEEPPAHCVFLLTCENRSLLLPTILSRVQVIPIEPLPEGTLEEALRNRRPGHTEEEYHQAVQGAAGSLGAALETLEAGEEQSLFSKARELLLMAQGQGEFALLAKLCAYERDREGFLKLLEGMKSQVSDALLASQCQNGAENPTKLTALQLLRIADIIEETARQAAQNGNMTLLTTAFCSRLKSAVSG